MRPTFCEPPWPPAPLKELTVATFGSSRKTAATRLCRATMAGKEVSSAASVEIWIWPMSSSGKKPFGMVTKSQAVAMKVSKATPSTIGRCRRATSSERE